MTLEKKDIYFLLQIKSAYKYGFLTLDVLTTWHDITSGSPDSDSFGFIYFSDDKEFDIVKMKHIKIIMDNGYMQTLNDSIMN